MKKLFWKVLSKLVDRHNERVAREIEDSKFLESLCTSNGTLNLNDYSKLLGMVKKKYLK